MAICGNCFNNIPDAGACPICGYDNTLNARKYASALPIGTVLNRRFFVGRVLGEGGFGITYLAQDYATKERVAIKEYFPTEFIARDKNTGSVQLHSEDRAESFLTGKQQFLAEARTLAEFIGDEHIVRIYRYFEENDTAYFAMEYVQGQALNKYLEDRKQLLTVDEANDLFLPLMESLANVHAKGIVHRNLSPDNIIIQPDGSGKIIDFGAARYSTGEMSKSLDVVLKHGFAPREQYTRRGRQGPFTDVYALAATYYFAITGKVPPDAIDRVDDDPFVPPSRQNPKISKKVDPVISKALASNYKDRYQSMTEFRDALIKACGPKKPTAEELNEAAYREACKLQETSKTEAEYKAVSKKFEKLGNYKDSKARITQCGDAVTALREEQRKQKEQQRLAKTEAKKLTAPKPEQGSAADVGTKKSSSGWLKVAIPLLLIAVILAVVFGARGGLKPSPAVTDPSADVETAPLPDEPEATGEPAPEAEALAEPGTPVLASAEGLTAAQTIGSLVTFGAYEQDNDTTNGKEPIEWIVLDVQDGKSLLISRYGLDPQPYHDTRTNITWEKCTLRTWLNDTFLNGAFSEEERARIPTVTVSADKNPDYDTDPGKDTRDQIFLLSIPEAEQYFDSGEARSCQPTAYAGAHQCYVNTAGNCFWWLRSPGYQSSFAAAVDFAGSINASGGSIRTNGSGGLFNGNVTVVSCAVRPALWIDLKAVEMYVEGVRPLVSAEGHASVQKTGSIVTFGAYEQDNDLENGTESIEWIVLDVQEGKSLLISRYALDSRQYSQNVRNNTWEKSSLRTWLNKDFLRAAFTTKEQTVIPTVTVTADYVPWNTGQGNDTQDQVFLLSIPEAEQYFGSDEARSCQPTAYAKAQGCAVSANYGTCQWWLRSPCILWGGIGKAGYVFSDGSVYTDGHDVSNNDHTVRPAMWVDTEKLKYMIPGNIVTFGSYEQDNDLNNGTEPVEWIVLDVQDGKSLLISRYGLDCQRYHDNSTANTWENSTLRAWLNDTFLNGAFREEERARIPTVTVNADKNPDSNISPGRVTKDRIFLLSIPEAEQYFDSNEARLCQPTAYTKAQGCLVSSSGNCWWWLRSPGSYSSFTAGVSSFGSVSAVGVDDRTGDGTVRPAIWIDTSK